MRGGYRELGQVAGPQSFHVERYVKALLSAASGDVSATATAISATGHRRLLLHLTANGPETGHVADDRRHVVAGGHAEV